MPRRTFFLLASCCLVACLAAGAEPQKTELTIEPAAAEIGIFYSGVPLMVSAQVETDVEVAVLVTGSSSALHLRRKGRVWGMFWAPSGEVSFENVPSLYLLRTSTEMHELASQDTLRKLGLGYEAFHSPTKEDFGEDLFEELVRLKESEGLYSSSVVAATLEDRPGFERQEVKVRVPIPANAPAGTYRVQLLGFKDQQLVTQGEAVFELGQTGLTALISSLAQEHGLVYGLLAVVAALASGLGVGFLFGSATKH